MQEILFLKGLPASGKSTFAKEYCLNNPEYERINKDDIREELDNPIWSKKFEEKVLLIEKIRGIEILLKGGSVIVDDTNFSPKHANYWMKISNFTEMKELENELNNLKNEMESKKL